MSILSDRWQGQTVVYDGTTYQVNVADDSVIISEGFIPANGQIKYKTTQPDDIYEFTLDKDLGGIGDAVDKVVFDRVSKRGYRENRTNEYEITGNENIAIFSSDEDIVCFYFPLVNGCSHLSGVKQAICTHWDIWSYSKAIMVSYKTEAFVLASTTNYFYGSIYANRLTTPNLAGIKQFFANEFANNTPVKFRYQPAQPTQSPLTFTKVSSSTAEEVPMEFLTNIPAPWYPADIKSTGGNLISRGKNLFDKNKISSGFALNLSSGQPMSAPSNSVSEYVSTYGNTQAVRTSGTTWFYYDQNKLYLGYNSTGIFPDNTFYLRFVLINIWDFNTFMCNFGSILLPHEPYHEPTIIPIPELCKVGGVPDVCNPVTGELLPNIGKYVVTGTERGWEEHPTIPGLFILNNAVFNVYVDASNVISMCSHYVSYRYYPEGNYGQSMGGVIAANRIFIKNIDYAGNIVGFKQSLANELANDTPVTVYYVKASVIPIQETPVVIPTFYKTTVIEQDSEVKGNIIATAKVVNTSLG